MRDLSRGGGPVTASVTFAGRAAFSRVLHVDLHRAAQRVSLTAARNVGDTSHVVARAAVRWLGLFVRNLELALYWGIAWVLLHLLLALLGADILGHYRLPSSLVLALEAVPGMMFAISAARLVVATARVRQVDVFAGAPNPRALTSGEAPRGWLLVRLLQPTDLDVLLVVVAAAALGWLAAR
ncbi:MAG: hypothetical protein ACR2MY_06205 [Candidatus Dormibacteria bacterium]